MYLVHIETGGNQGFIFASNKLREIVGASELIHRVGARWLLTVVGAATESAVGPTAVGRWVEDQGGAIAERGADVEVLIATSGKAVLVARDRATACHIVQEVTRRALREAPGLEVVGAVTEISGSDWGEAVTRSHEGSYPAARLRRPPSLARLRRLPLVADCATTSLPAQCYDAGAPEPGPRSASANKKREAASDARARFDDLLEGQGGARLATSIDELVRSVEELEWVAVVHADANGLGDRFTSLKKQAEEGAQLYAHNYRRLSLAVEDVTVTAFRKAVKETWGGGDDGIVPLIPVIVGGDDLTVVCDGRRALRFAHAFARLFGELAVHSPQSEHTDVVKAEHTEVIKDTGGQLTTAVGVAIVKPHFPFSTAHELAVELLRSAKRRKPDAAIDFHVLYDASATTLGAMRAGLRREEAWLTARPYLVDGHGPDSWDGLTKRVAVLLESNPGDPARRRLPRSQLQRLRRALFSSPELAESQFARLTTRHPGAGRLGGENGLFWSDCTGARVTGFLDALEASAFLAGEAA